MKQSFIYIDNLCEQVRLIIEHQLKGIFCPQDEKAVCANELLKAIMEGLGKKYRESRLLGLIIQLICFVPLVKKAYGGTEYEMNYSKVEGMDYVVVPFDEGMRRTVAPDK